jgi:hypothetical protein
VENLVIEIGAHTKEFLTGLNEVGEHTKDLGDRLAGIGVVAATAFAGYTASIMGCVYAYREQEKVGQEVEAILHSTGGVAGVTAHAINELAESLSKSSTFSKLQIERGEEILLTFTQIGSKTFPEATTAMLDLAQKMGGDASGAAQVLGRALEDPMAGLTKLRRAGIFFTEQQKDQIKTMELSGNMAGAQAVILKQVESQYGGMAKAAAGGTGAIAQVKNAMEELAEKVGAEFAPYVAKAAETLRDMIRAATEHEGLIKLTSAVLAGGAAVTGIITGIVAGTFAIKQLGSAIETARLIVEAFGVSSKVAIGATGVGLLAVVVVEIYEHWNTLWPAMKEIFHTFVNTVTQAAQGLSRVLRGAFHLDMDEIKAGLAQAAQAFVEGAKATGHTVANLFVSTPEQRKVASEAGHQAGNAEGLAQQKALMAAEARTRRLQFDAIHASHEALMLELAGHTKKVVDLKKQEASTLKQMATTESGSERKALQKHLTEIQAEYKKAEANEKKERAAFDKFRLKANADYSTAEIAQITATIQTEEDAHHQHQLTLLNDEIASNNTRLEETERYGAAYAKISQFTHQKVITESESSLSQMAQMQQSKNKELKAIGQAASVLDIEIKTAQAALAVYAGFQSLPFGLGIPIGLAAAAVVEAYGQEQAATVLGLSQGGMVPFGMGKPGIDSVPIMGMPGELMAPPQNFEEVVGSVAAKRLGEKQLADTQTGPAQPTNVRVIVELKGQAARMLQVQAVQDKALGTYRGS